jgi:hypothetical protein
MLLWKDVNVKMVKFMTIQVTVVSTNVVLMVISTMIMELASVMMDLIKILAINSNSFVLLLVLMVTVKKTSTKTVMITVSVTKNTSGTIIKENYIVNKPNQKTNALLQLGIQSKEDVNVKEIVKSMTSIIIVSITV